MRDGSPRRGVVFLLRKILGMPRKQFRVAGRPTFANNDWWIVRISGSRSGQKPFMTLRLAPERRELNG